ncbi:MAG: DUF262 domain-containing protein [Gallionella sp.]|nr:DUF262 domain-containing protein [Gallionella sp.]
MIQPEFKSLNTILSDKLFSIPEYQRHYSWQTKQRQDLFGDIKKLSEAKRDSHFMATIVCLNTQTSEITGSDNFYVHDIVDGQQRLTTLVILLKAISLKLRGDGQIAEADKLDDLLVKGDKRLIILQNNHGNKSLLRSFLELNDAEKADNFYQKTDQKFETVADKNLCQAIKDCNEFVNTVSNTIDLLGLVKNKLWFIFLSLQDKSSVYTIFEVLNSRGLDVDWLDKCKSILMGLLYETAQNRAIFDQHLKELQGSWSAIYREIGHEGNIAGHEIVRFTATLMNVDGGFGKVMNTEEALEFFKKACEEKEESTTRYSIGKIIDITEKLKKTTSCLSQLYKNKRLSAVAEISQARLLAVSIMSTDLDEVTKNKLLDQWERTSFKIYGLFKKDSRTKVGDYVRVAKYIQDSSSSSVDELIKLIADIARDETGAIVFDINSSVIDEEMKKDCYNNGWDKKLRYFFYKYEEYLAKKMGYKLNDIAWSDIWNSSLSKTIEHVLPQNRNAKEGWGHFSAEEHTKYLHSIGNLCLLPQHVNLKASDNSFDIRLVLTLKNN